LIRCGESKTNGVQFGRGHVVRSLHTAQNTALQIMKENQERCLAKCFNYFRTYVTVRLQLICKETTVDHFASTFDNADHSS